MLGRCIGRILPRRTNGVDLELRKRLQGRYMGDRGKPAVWTYPDNSHSDSAVCRHECFPDVRRVLLPLHKLDHDSFRSADEASGKPGLRVNGPVVITAPLARNSSKAASASSTVRPICSKP